MRIKSFATRIRPTKNNNVTDTGSCPVQPAILKRDVARVRSHRPRWTADEWAIAKAKRPEALKERRRMERAGWLN